MNKYLISLIGLFFSALVGCQVIAGEQTVNEYGSDAAITANVKTALLDDSRVTSLPIHVQTDKGLVVLSGFVKTNKQKVAAEQAARRVKGINSVKNNLIVRR